VLPWAYIEAILWERFHWLPDELDRQDAQRVLGGVSLLTLGEIVPRLKKDMKSLSPRDLASVKDLIGRK